MAAEMKPDRRSGKGGALLLLAGSLLTTGCHGHATAPAPERRSVHCGPIETAEVADAIELRGTIAPLPDRDAQIAPQVAGRIVQLLAREGDRVAAGQPVARVDDSVLVDQENEAKAVLEKVRAERRNADATHARTERVFEHGIAARQEVDDAATRAATARAAENEAEAASKRARRQVDRATVRSPIAGVVVRLLRRPGELVDGTPATPVMEVADPSRLELVSDATASDLVRIEKSARAELSVAALPGLKWTGAVAAVSPAVDRTTGLGAVRVAVDLAAAARPPIGALGAARITVGSARSATVVPKQALRGGVGLDADVVVCGPDGIAHVRRVKRGVDTGNKVEATPLTAGELVALDPLGIADGDAIEMATTK
jgi:RND family efflux transporter MFP subunit